MILSVDEQLKLIETIRDEVGNLGDYLYPDKDPYVNAFQSHQSLCLGE